MWIHHTTGRQPDADTLHVYEGVDNKVHTGIRHRRITHSRAYALIVLGVNVLHAEILVRRISPVGLSDLKMHQLGRTLCESVRKYLGQHTPIDIFVATVVHCFINRRSEHTDLVCFAL